MQTSRLSSIELDLLPIKFYIAGIGDFALFCCCDLDLDPMTFIYEPDPYPLKMYSQTKMDFSLQAFESYRSLLHTKRQTDRQTDFTENITMPASKVVTEILLTLFLTHTLTLE